MKLNRSTLSPAEIVDKIMETYIQYSDDTNSLINFNYCILPDLVESKTTKSLLTTLISPLCNWIIVASELFACKCISVFIFSIYLSWMFYNLPRLEFYYILHNLLWIHVNILYYLYQGLILNKKLVFKYTKLKRIAKFLRKVTNFS